MESWIITYNKYKPKQELLRETICTLGNGYFAARGAMEGSIANDIHYPGTYLAGGYNRLRSEVAGRVIQNEDLVNWPNWLILKFKIDNGPWFDIDHVRILEYNQSLNLKHGTLERTIHFVDEEGKESKLISRRIVHMGNEHVAAIHWQLIPLNWSGKVTIRSGLDGGVINSGVKRYRALSGRHFDVLERGDLPSEGIYLKVRTRRSEIVMVQAAVTEIYFGPGKVAIKRDLVKTEEFIAEDLEFEIPENQEISIYKKVAIYTSRDHAISNPLIEAEKAILRSGSFSQLEESQKETWQELWNRCDTVIEGRGENQLMLRLHIFHLLQTTSFNTTNLDVGVPPRGWHGEAYRGHIFWDELFIFPLLNLSIPEITRSLLMYRYRRLPEARYAAQLAGFEGAMYPWQSGSDGREESQQVHLNPQSGRWIPDDSSLQRHVNAAIAYNIWQYFQVTYDREFLSFFGAEMFFDIARFWASVATYNKKRRRYEINHVVGPDEYHTQYPDTDELGINNNAYTNIMAVWTLLHAFEIFNNLDEGTKNQLMNKLRINEEEIDRWDKISRKMFVPFIGDTKIISQFEGFEDLKELDWDKYHDKYGEILRLDRILETENDSPNNYRVAKQADVLMLFYLFSSEELISLFKHMGYEFTDENKAATIEYYEKRTSHGSTLSKLVTSWVTARSNRDISWKSFEKALVSDFKDIQGGTTPEGIHLGAMAGTVDLIRRCYTGLELRKGVLWLKPHLPPKLRRISFKLRYHGHWLNLDLSKKQFRLKSEGGWADRIRVNIDNREYELKTGDEIIFNGEEIKEVIYAI
ncbi:glycoside hydrolase family 65 protein [Bacteroidota bacterium]